jgi:hypothetical protein
MGDGIANSVAEGDHDDDSGNVEEYSERLNNIKRSQFGASVADGG